MKPLHRRVITLICFLVVTTTVSSLFIYLDSVSVRSWNDYNDIGPVAILVQGDTIDEIEEELRNLPYVTTACQFQTAYAYLRMDMNEYYSGSPTDPLEPMFLVEGRAYSISEEFIQSFSSEFNLVEGRYPQNSSEITIALADANYWNIPIGRMMNYTHSLNGHKRTIFVVGYFEPSKHTARAILTDAIAIVTPDVLNPETVKSKAYVDIDRTILQASDPRGSLNQLRIIEKSIIDLNPSDAPTERYLVDDYLAVEIQSYIEELDLVKSRQISRAQSIILLSGLFSFLGTRFNLTMRKSELNTLEIRGATRNRILRIVFSELWLLSLISGVLAIITGTILSKIAWMSEDYMSFNVGYLVASSTLLTVDTLTILCLTIFIIPIFGYLSSQLIKIKPSEQTEQGRLARLNKSIRIVRWDISTILVVSILMAVFYLGGDILSNNPLLSLIASFSTIPLFVAIVSVFNKISRFISYLMSRIFSRFFGKTQALLGVRGIINSRKISVPVVLIIALVLTTVLTNDASATSLPETHLFQSRYVIGGDLSFHLENDEYSEWDDFDQLVRNSEGVQNTSLVSIGVLSLSEGSSGIVEFVAINPYEYSKVGYSFSGEALDKSPQNSLLQELESNAEGAILTADIAREYDLNPGDTLRAFSFGGESDTIEFNIIAITESIPRPAYSYSSTTQSVVGMRKIWLNRNYVDDLVSFNNTGQTFLCARCTNDVNVTKIGEEALENFGIVIISSDEWSSTDADIQNYISQSTYRLDRQIDNLVTVTMTIFIFVGLLIFLIFQKYNGREERAILRSLGASNGQLLKIHLAESATIILLSLVILCIFAPLNIANLLRIGLADYQIWGYSFPISLFVFINWSRFLLIFGMITIPTIIITSIFSIKEHDDVARILKTISQENSFPEGID